MSRTKPEKNKEEVKENLESKDAAAENLESKEEAKESLEGGVIEPIAFSVKLKALHPNESYGRCGYRFRKNEAIEIPFEALTGEQIIALSQDPYLDFLPITQE